MGTRAVVIFKDESGSFKVYKHWDGYPDNMVPLIKAAACKAWELPRFEADEYAAAFVAHAKKGSGDVRLLNGAIPPDVEFVYSVTCKAGVLNIAVREV
jgi:hypothetical protein